MAGMRQVTFEIIMKWNPTFEVLLALFIIPTLLETQILAESEVWGKIFECLTCCKTPLVFLQLCCKFYFSPIKGLPNCLTRFFTDDIRGTYWAQGFIFCVNQQFLEHDLICFFRFLWCSGSSGVQVHWLSSKLMTGPGPGPPFSFMGLHHILFAGFHKVRDGKGKYTTGRLQQENPGGKVNPRLGPSHKLLSYQSVQLLKFRQTPACLESIHICPL